MALSFHRPNKKTDRNRQVFFGTLHNPDRSRLRSLEPHDEYCPEWRAPNYNPKCDTTKSGPTLQSRDPWNKEEWSHYESTKKSNEVLDRWRNKRATLPEFMIRDDRAEETASFKPVKGGSVGGFLDIMTEKINAYDNRQYQENYGDYMYNKFIWDNPLNKDYNYKSYSNGVKCGEYIGRSRLGNPQGNLDYKSTAHFYDMRNADRLRMRAKAHNRYVDYDASEALSNAQFTECPRKRYSGRPRTTREVRKDLFV